MSDHRTATKPRVILVGGAPMSGKSTVARLLAGRRDQATIATDDLGAAVRADRAARADSSAPSEDYREYYVVRSVERLWQEALIGHRALAPAIAAVVRMHAGWAAPAVIEGWALLPELVAALADELPAVVSVWLVAGRELLEARARADTAFWTGASDVDAMISGFVGRSLRFNEHVSAFAKQRSLQLVHVSGGESPDAVADRIDAITGPG